MKIGRVGNSLLSKSGLVAQLSHTLPKGHKVRVLVWSVGPRRHACESDHDDDYTSRASAYSFSQFGCCAIAADQSQLSSGPLENIQKKRSSERHMANLKTVGAFRGSAKNPSRTCESCGTSITKGDPYCWWENRLPSEDGETKHFRCMAQDCEPLPWELEGNPKRKPLLRAYDDVVVRLLEISQEDFATPEALLDELWKTTEIVTSGLKQSADVIRIGARNIIASAGHPTRGSDEIERRATDLEDAGRRLRLNVRFEPWPVQPESHPEELGSENTSHDPGFDEEMRAWKNRCLYTVVWHARDAVELLGPWR